MRTLITLLAIASVAVDANGWGKTVKITLHNGEVINTSIGLDRNGRRNELKRFPHFEHSKYKEIKFTGWFPSLVSIFIGPEWQDEGHAVFGLEKIVLGKNNKHGFQPDYLYHSETMSSLSQITVKGCPSLKSISTEVELPKLTSMYFHGVTNSQFSLPKGLEWLKTLSFGDCDIEDVYLKHDTFKYQIIKADIREEIKESVTGVYNKTIEERLFSDWGFGARIWLSKINKIHMSRRLGNAILRDRSYGNIRLNNVRRDMISYLPTQTSAEIKVWINPPVGKNLSEVSWTSGDLYRTKDFINWEYVGGPLKSPKFIWFPQDIDGNLIDGGGNRFYKVIQEIPEFLIKQKVSEIPAEQINLSPIPSVVIEE